MDLSGKVALITGAGSGLGRAVALSFARIGATLIVLDLDQAAAQDTLHEAGVPGVALTADVADEDAVQAAVTQALSAIGHIDVLVNNAGIGGVDGPKLAHEMSMAEWHRVLAVNLTGPFVVCSAVLPSMLVRQSGVIINIASAVGMVTFAGRSAYVTSKAGLIHLTRNLAVEYAKYGIRANALCPGWMDTPLTQWRLGDPAAAARVRATIPIGRVAQPQEIAEACVFLACDSSKYMTGQVLVVDGGWTAR